uniref:Uncharacterized protein n=1 Tax=Romanomermis culicivorax TaxID=13658 RepID=A0A915IN43_ROMCU
MLINMFLEFGTFMTISIITLIHIPRAKRTGKEFITALILLPISIIGALPMINLLLRHCKLASKNQTTRDLYKHIFAEQPKKDPFDKGVGINLSNFLFSPQRPSILDHMPKKERKTLSIHS